MTSCRQNVKKIVGVLVVLGGLSNPAIVRAAGDVVCIDNQFEVAWVHPGVTFFLERDEGTCAGEHITLQEGETGCFETYPVQYDGSWYLSALDATTAKCRAVCAVQTSKIRIQFSVTNTFSCTD